MNAGIRVGVDVGGTFTKAVALQAHPLALLHHEVVPTSHGAAGGVSEGVAAALRALLEHLGDRRGDRGRVEPACRVEEGVLGPQDTPWGELHVAHARALARAAQLGLGPDADHADARDVAFEQRVHRLRGRVGDQLDLTAPLAQAFEQRAQRRRDALAHAAGRAVTGGHDLVVQQRQRVRLQGDGLREGPAHVDADADGAHAAAASMRRRRAGCHANTQRAPRT